MYSISFAQPTLTASGSNPVIGDNYTYSSTSYFSAGSAGASQTWNYGSLTGSSPTFGTIVSVGSTPNGASFPNATISGKNVTGGNYSYLKTSASAYQNYGIVSSGGVIMSYSNPEDQMHYPFTFNNTYSDPWAVNFINGGYTFYRKGTTTLTADGYGTLITPAGTYNNTLRIHFVQNYTDSVDFGGTPLIYTYNNDEYFWYLDGTHTALAATYVLTVNGSPSQGSLYLSSTVGINDITKSISMYDIYPNPASDFIKLDFTLTENKNVELRLFNSIGEKLDLKQMENGIQGLNSIEVNVATLPKGIYFAQILLDDNVAQTKRFVISK